MKKEQSGNESASDLVQSVRGSLDVGYQERITVCVKEWVCDVSVNRCVDRSIVQLSQSMCQSLSQTIRDSVGGGIFFFNSRDKYEMM